MPSDYAAKAYAMTFSHYNQIPHLVSEFHTITAFARDRFQWSKSWGHVWSCRDSLLHLRYLELVNVGYCLVFTV